MVLRSSDALAERQHREHEQAAPALDLPRNQPGDLHPGRPAQALRRAERDATQVPGLPNARRSLPGQYHRRWVSNGEAVTPTEVASGLARPDRTSVGGNPNQRKHDRVSAECSENPSALATSLMLKSELNRSRSAASLYTACRMRSNVAPSFINFLCKVRGCIPRNSATRTLVIRSDATFLASILRTSSDTTLGSGCIDFRFAA